MKNYSSAFTNITQSQPLPGRKQVQNNAGGFVYEISPQERLERFLLIGSEGGTYYVNEQKLTVENASKVIDYIKTDGLKVVQTVVDFATENRAPKADAGLFVLALATAYGDDATKRAAYSAIYKVCKTSTHLFTFLSNVQNLRGWSRGLRNGVANFYNNRTPEQVAYQLVKYRNRSGFTHQDALRLSHARPATPAHASLFGYATGKVAATESGSTLVQAFETAQNASGKELAGLIEEHRLTWEMVPNDKLNDSGVLTALLKSMPLVALTRNLNRFSYNDLTKSQNETVKTIVSKLTDAEFVKKSGIHPINVVNSLLTYSSGRGQKSDKTWTANRNIVDALNDTYELALKALTPTGKTILIAVDISGSMSSPVGGYQMTCSQVANLLALTVLRTEKNAELVWFDTGLHTPNLSRRSSFQDAIRNTPNGGGTDCSQAFVHALSTKTKYDAIIILTDNETWAGRHHGETLLAQYRRQLNPDVKVVEVALEANAYSTLPDDKNLLRVVGFDSSVTEVINQFLK